MLKHTSLPSIEEFAAFLDGNLSANDMQQFTQLAAHDDALHQLLHATSVVDDTLDGLTDADLQLPADLMNADFELPEIPSSDDASMLVSLSPEPMDDMLVAACADDDVSAYSDINQDEHITIGEDILDNSTLTMPDNDGFDNNDDLSGSFFNDILDT